MQESITLPTYVRFSAKLTSVTNLQMKTLSLTPKTLEYLELLEGNNYNYDDMIEFIEQHGEEDFLKYYEEYVGIGEVHSYEAVDAFIKTFDIADLSSFDDVFYGEYEDVEDFVEHFISEMDVEIPDYIVVDYAQTWKSNLRHDFVFEDNFVFDRNF